MARDLMDRDMVATLREQFGDRSDFEDLIHLFEVTGGERLARLDAAVRGDDSVAITEIAHSIKGSAAALGATGLAESAGRVEADPSLAGDELVEMRDTLRQSVEALRGTSSTDSDESES
jgi:HPt (histidine-containing phosphotransfer) domain-containing protein